MAIGPVGLRRNRATGVPRRTARHWDAISRLVVPLDAVRAVLHHGDDPKFRRAGAQAAAVVLQNCADAGQSYWAWSSWDWARLAGAVHVLGGHGRAHCGALAGRPGVLQAESLAAALGSLRARLGLD